MSKRLNLVVLYGGKSGEHEVSLVSSASVLAHLDRERFNVIPIGMDKEGQFYLNDEASLRQYDKALPVQGPNAKRLPSLLIDGKFVVDADVVFPVVHGPLYEDGSLQGILELANIAYVGCHVMSSAIGMDKDMSRRVACRDGVQSVGYRSLSWFASEDEVDAFCHEVIKAYGFPLFVKPCRLGSSVGVHKANNLEALKFAIEDAKRYDSEILVEQYCQGREIEVAVLENANPSLPPRVSLPGEISVHHRDGFYSYTAKYLESDKTAYAIPPQNLSVHLQETVQKQAAQIFTALKCRGLARVDFFVDDKSNQVYFNEINTLPGFTSISMYPKMWQATGVDYTLLLNQLVELALTHHRCRERLVTHYQ